MRVDVSDRLGDGRPARARARCIARPARAAVGGAAWSTICILRAAPAHDRAPATRAPRALARGPPPRRRTSPRLRRSRDRRGARSNGRHASNSLRGDGAPSRPHPAEPERVDHRVRTRRTARPRRRLARPSPPPCADAERARGARRRIDASPAHAAERPHGPRRAGSTRARNRTGGASAGVAGCGRLQPIACSSMRHRRRLARSPRGTPARGRAPSTIRPRSAVVHRAAGVEATPRPPRAARTRPCDCGARRARRARRPRASRYRPASRDASHAASSRPPTGTSPATWVGNVDASNHRDPPRRRSGPRRARPEQRVHTLAERRHRADAGDHRGSRRPLRIAGPRRRRRRRSEARHQRAPRPSPAAIRFYSAPRPTRAPRRRGERVAERRGVDDRRLGPALRRAHPCAAHPPRQVVPTARSRPRRLAARARDPTARCRSRARDPTARCRSRSTRPDRSPPAPNPRRAPASASSSASSTGPALAPLAIAQPSLSRRTPSAVASSASSAAPSAGTSPRAPRAVAPRGARHLVGRRVRTAARDRAIAVAVRDCVHGLDQRGPVVPAPAREQRSCSARAAPRGLRRGTS